MHAYWLGTESPNQALVGLISKWNIQSIHDLDKFKSIVGKSPGKIHYFLMELPEINEKKFLELKAISERYERKLKFIIFYHSLKRSPLINKLHGSDVLLLGPEDRNHAEIILKRFFHYPIPLFRRWERFQLVTAGTLSSLSNSKSAQKIAIVNFSVHGACVRIQDNMLKKKDYVVLEYLSHDGKKIRMHSRISWEKTDGLSRVVGVQFIAREK